MRKLHVERRVLQALPRPLIAYKSCRLAEIRQSSSSPTPEPGLVHGAHAVREKLVNVLLAVKRIHGDISTGRGARRIVTGFSRYEAGNICRIPARFIQPQGGSRLF